MTDPACDRYGPTLARAADGSLTPAEAQSWRHHLTSCADCRDELSRQIAMRDLVRRRPPLDASAGFDARVGAALDARRPWLTQLDFRQWTWRLLPAAAVLLVVAYLTAARSTAANASVTMTVTTTSTNMPVSSALWSSEVPDDALLSLMLHAHADDSLADALRRHP